MTYLPFLSLILMSSIDYQQTDDTFQLDSFFAWLLTFVFIEVSIIDLLDLDIRFSVILSHIMAFSIVVMDVE